LLIISELPLHEHNAITQPQLRLLKSIRLSLGYLVSEPAQTLIMNWPLVDNNKIDQSEEAAFEAVQAQLKKQMEKYQPPYLVLMGVAAVRHVLGLSTSFDEVRGQLIANESLCAAVTYSVNELLKVPSLKSSTWKDLQAIRRSLT
jgi:uracil-DNA glycosylase family 4